MKTVKLKHILNESLFTDGDWIESKDQDPSGKIRLIQLADIGDGCFIDKSNRFINEETAQRLKCTFLRKGDLLIARMPDPLGRCCIFPFSEEQSYITVVDVCIMRLNAECDNRYIQHAINNPKIRRDIEGQSTGTTRTRITRKKLGELEIPLPSLPEQKRIAAILDEADRLRQKDKQLIEKYNQLSQSVFLDMFGDPVVNAKGWEKNVLSDLTTKIGSGSTPRGGKESYIEEGISLIRSLNVYDGFFKYKNLAHINTDQGEKLRNVVVEENDVLFNITGASVCRCSVVPLNVLPARVNQHVAILRTDENKLDSTYLSKFLISRNIKEQLLNIASKGGATREALTKDDLVNYQITIPPISLQKKFATIIAKIEQQKAQAEKSLAKSEELFNSLLQRAFKGEL